MRWVKIKGYNYQASDTGNIRNISTGRILKASISNAGYAVVCLSRENKKRSFTIHRLVAECFLDKISKKNEVNHKNGIKTDNRLENLEWVSRIENMAHAVNTGLFPNQYGERNNNVKLLDRDLLKIMDLKNLGKTQNEIASIFGVSQSNISLILNLKSRK